MEPVLDVGNRHREFGRVDDALLQGREDVRTGKELGGSAHLLHDLRAEPEEPHLEALEVLGRVGDFLAEPAGGLRTDAEAVDRGHAVRVVELLAQLVAAAVPLPGLELAERGPERHRGEERNRTAEHVGVVAGGRPACIDRALGDRLELLRSRHERPRFVELDLEVAPGHLRYALGERDTSGTEHRDLGPEGARHLPADALLRTRVERTNQGDGAGEAGRHDGSCMLVDHDSSLTFRGLPNNRSDIACLRPLRPPERRESGHACQNCPDRL